MRWGPKSSNQVGVVEARFRATIKSSPKPPRTSASLTTSWARSWASLLSKRRSAARSSRIAPKLPSPASARAAWAAAKASDRDAPPPPGERAEAHNPADRDWGWRRSRRIQARGAEQCACPIPYGSIAPGRDAAELRRLERRRGLRRGALRSSAPLGVELLQRALRQSANHRGLLETQGGGVPPSPARNRPQPWR